MKRIGIYAGTFDPVHAGHITFALQALEAAGLDQVVFLPERRPRGKQDVEHFGHRVAMLRRALKPHPQFEVAELVDVSFSVARTLPHLQKLYPDSELVFLFGSDVVPGVSEWPNAAKLIKGREFVIGLRSSDDHDMLRKTIETWPEPREVTIFESFAPEVSSNKIREALRLRRPTKGVLKSVERYSDRHWLYVSLA